MPRTQPFEENADQYDAWFETNRELYLAELAAIRLLMPPAPARGLEVGVGSGKFAVPLGIPTGVEPSERMATRAEALGIRVFRGVAEKLPFPAAEFDFVLMVTTICFVDDILESFREAFRVLKPAGCIIVGFVDKDSELGRQYLERRHQSAFYKDASFYSTDEVCRHLLAAGFSDPDYRQALIPGQPPGLIREGFGQGAFIVVRAVES